jgi:H2-forming N5,N10-methylenetetrahydromethanopterin dehydrogenase-like enzyme
MSNKNLKTENDSLKIKLNNILLEKQLLEKQISELNENTIIESMNDMKLELEQMQENTVPIQLMYNLREHLKQSKNTISSINSINSILIDDLYNFKYLINDKNITNKDEYFEKYFTIFQNTFGLIKKIVNKYEEDYSDVCDCEN